MMVVLTSRTPFIDKRVYSESGDCPCITAWPEGTPKIMVRADEE